MKKVGAAVGTFVLLLALSLFSAAQEEPTFTAQRGLGADYLTDSEGRSVYIYLRDGPNSSTCTDACEVNWPPVLVTGELTAGPGVLVSLMSTLERADGTAQLVYNGWPLYYYAHDSGPGEAHGHRLGEVFYLISTSGSRVHSAIESQISEAVQAAQAEAGGDQATQEVADAEVLDGEHLYVSNCAACHGREGEGAVGPGLAGNAAMERADYIISTVLFGREGHGMPPFADVLSNDEIAAIVTHVRQSWDNSYPAVTPAAVDELR